MKLIKRSNGSLPARDGRLRACLYLRVSTGRQAESDLSIPDQRKSVQAYCAAHGWPVIAEHVEPGASALDDNRPAFQAMITRAEDGDRPYDVIVVHSLSRFFRDALGLEMYVRRLAKVGVRLVSITQELGDDPAAEMMRQMFALFDEYSSLENSKHVQRAMNENARQGFYNGSNLPLGYTLEEVERRGSRMKKRAIVDPVEAETVRLIFRLYRHGDGRSGPLGVKAICCHLNERGLPHAGRRPLRRGNDPPDPDEPNLCGRVGLQQALLEDGAGEAEGRAHPRCGAADHRAGCVRGSAGDAQGAQSARHAGACGVGPDPAHRTCDLHDLRGAMTLRTGTSKSKKVHSYYSCSTKGRQGATGCSGRSIRMATLDTLVMDHLVTELLQPDRLRATLASLWALRAERAAEVDVRGTALRGELAAAEEKLRRLYRLVEDGEDEPDDLLKERLLALRAKRDLAKAALARMREAGPSPSEIGPELIERFGRLMREKVSSGEVPFRKAWLQAIVDRIEVGADMIRIIGDKESLETALTGADGTAVPGVRSSVRKWRALRESNPPLQRERLTS